MANGKWIAGLTAATSLEAGARRALAVRLEAVGDHLKPAAEAASEDVEHVHQLRVATRRCRAAIDLFAEVLPEKLYQRLRKVLRRIRRTAGPARDWDVFFLSLAPRLAKATARTAPGLHWVAGQVVARRLQAQQALADASPQLARDLRRLAGEALHLKASAGRNGSATELSDLAGERVVQLIDAVEQAGQGDLKEQEQLHRLRIEGKRLRYAMEVFADCFPPAFRETLYPWVEAMQEHLGNVNDAYVALSVLDDVQSQAPSSYPLQWLVWQAGVNALKTSWRQRMRRERQRFVQFWSDWQKHDVRGQFGSMLTARYGFTGSGGGGSGGPGRPTTGAGTGGGAGCVARGLQTPPRPETGGQLGGKK